MSNTICDGNCFKCIYDDCINDEISYSELSQEDLHIEVDQQKKKARDRSNRYAEKHREENRQRSLEYYYKNKDRLNKKKQQWNKDNSLRISARKRERYQENKELFAQKQRDYRAKVKESLPHCNDCGFCILVQNDKGDGHRRLCVHQLRLIEQKVSTSPKWCCKRKENKNEDSKN